MPTFEVKTPVGANQIWMRAADSRSGRRGDAARQAAAELGRLDHRQELRRQPRARHADHPFRSVGARRDRDQTDSEGRRLREHQRAVRTAGRAAAPGTRRSHARRRAQVHPARGLAGAGQGLRARRGRCLRRRRSHVGLRPREGAAVPHARRRQSGSAARGDRSGGHVDGQRSRDRHDGVRRQGDADRLQDRRAQPPAGELFRVGRLRLLGVPAPRRRAQRAERRDRHVAVPRSLASDHPDARSGRLPADRQGGRAARAAQRGRRPRAQSRRRRDDLGPRCSPAATRCIRT